jgi:hypothetical protein
LKINSGRQLRAARPRIGVEPLEGLAPLRGSDLHAQDARRGENVVINLIHLTIDAVITLVLVKELSEMRSNDKAASGEANCAICAVVQS